MRSTGKPSAASNRVAATSAGSSPFGAPYFTLRRVPSAIAQLNFGVEPPIGSATKLQSTSAFASNAFGPAVFLLKSIDAGTTRGGTHTLACESASLRTVSAWNDLAADGSAAAETASRSRHAMEPAVTIATAATAAACRVRVTGFT